MFRPRCAYPPLPASGCPCREPEPPEKPPRASASEAGRPHRTPYPDATCRSGAVYRDVLLADVHGNGRNRRESGARRLTGGAGYLANTSALKASTPSP